MSKTKTTKHVFYVRNIESPQTICLIALESTDISATFLLKLGNDFNDADESQAKHSSKSFNKVIEFLKETYDDVIYHKYITTTTTKQENEAEENITIVTETFTQKMHKVYKHLYKN